MSYSLEAKAQEVADILKLVAHPKRLLILCRLSQDSATVGELEDFCWISQSQISQFLAKMRTEGLVQSNRKGHFIVYSIGDSRVLSLLQSLATIYCR